MRGPVRAGQQHYKLPFFSWASPLLQVGSVDALLRSQDFHILVTLDGSYGEGTVDRDMDDVDGGESSSLKLQQQCPKKIPTLYEIARAKSVKYSCDDKQFIVYQMVCFTFLLQLVTWREINMIPSLENC